MPLMWLMYQLYHSCYIAVLHHWQRVIAFNICEIRGKAPFPVAYYRWFYCKQMMGAIKSALRPLVRLTHLIEL